MAKHFFTWTESSRGPVPVLYHFNPENVGPDTKAYGSKILAVHPLPDDFAFNKEDTYVLRRLAEKYPPPTN